MRAYGISERGLLAELMNQSLRKSVICAVVIHLRGRHWKSIVDLHMLIHLMTDLVDRAFEKVLIVDQKAQGS